MAMEYRLIVSYDSLLRNRPERFGELLSRWTADGWEFVSYQPVRFLATDIGLRLLFRRPVSSAPWTPDA